MGLIDLAGNATLLYYMSEEGCEGKQAFLEKRPPDFSKFPRVPWSFLTSFSMPAKKPRK